MRVVHLSSYDTAGGAARAAFRLHESLLAAGEQSAMLVRTKNSKAESVEQATRGKNSKAFFGELIQNHYLDQNRTALSSTWFSLGWPGEDLSTHPLIEQADIIHLHWVTDFLSPCSLAALQSMGKPIVWTLHDQRAYTGGCHYTAGCAQYETDCAACPQLVADPCRLTAANLADQLQIGVPSAVTVIAPSRWMAQCARRSAVFARSRIEVIPYGIDHTRFRAVPQIDARRRLGLPADSFLLLFGVDNAREKRKGLRELFEVLNACAQEKSFRQVARHQKVVLLCFGKLDRTPELPVSVKNFGRVESDEVLSSLYSAADLFLLPSLEDNLPNTVLEAMCCGTPVGAFRTGGVPDLVVEGETGFLAPTGDLQKLVEIVLTSASNPRALRNMRPACCRHVREHFSYERQSQACLALYRDLLRNEQCLQRKRPRTSKTVGTGEAAPELQRIFPQLLQYVFETGRVEVPSSSASPTDKKEQFRRAQFVRRVRRILESAAEGSLRIANLRASLDAELAILGGKSAWRVQAKLFFNRILRIP